MANMVLAASRSVPYAPAVAAATLEMAKLPNDSWVFLRKPTKKPASPFELAVAAAASNLGINVRWWTPGPGGRQATFLRDVAMVEAADEVVCYFTEEEEMTGGTGHIVEKALDRGRRCRAYSIVDNALRWVGGHDPEDPI